MRKVLLMLGVLDDGDLDWLVATGAKRDLAPGTLLIREGVPVVDVFLVLDGLLAVRTHRTGDKDVARLRSGEIVGEMSFVDSRPPSASVHVMEPSSVLAVPRTALAARLESDLAFAARFYRALAMFLSQRLRATVGQLGYGLAEPQPDDAIEAQTLENLALAGARFEWLQRRMKER